MVKIEYAHTESIESICFISIDRIAPDPEQPRKYFDEAEEMRLSNSIKAHGLLQPILVTPIEDPNYDFKIICGERRYRAHKRLGLKTIKSNNQRN